MKENKEKVLRTALIGVGVMGKKYAQMLCAGEIPSLVLTAAVCRNENSRKWMNDLCSDVKIYESAEALFNNPEEYDAVIIATPHKSHPILAEQAFNIGKNVMCDKPAGISVSDAVKMNKAAKSSKKVYGIMFHQRLYPKYMKIKQILEKGDIGELNRIMLVNSRYLRTSHYHHSGSWRSSWNGEGGGALINQGQHILDIWQWLFGMPEKLYADIPFGKYNDFNVDDEVTIHMRYKNALTAVFILTTGEAIWEERLEIVGSKGKILLEDNMLHIWYYSEDCSKYIRTAKVNSRENLSVREELITFEDIEEPYSKMLDNFANAVLNDCDLAADGKDAVNPIMLTNAAYYSAWKNKLIELPINTEEYDKMLLEQCSNEKI